MNGRLRARDASDVAAQHTLAGPVRAQPVDKSYTPFEDGDARPAVSFRAFFQGAIW
jgi:hypothetical protein